MHHTISEKKQSLLETAYALYDPNLVVHRVEPFEKVDDPGTNLVRMN